MTPTDNRTVTPEAADDEQRAWAWLDGHFIGSVEDCTYSADEMVDAFLAGIEARPEPSPLPDGELVTRLLQSPGDYYHRALLKEAATALTRLEADNARLRKVLITAHEKFLEYEEMHLAKLRPEFGVASAVAAERAEANDIARQNAKRNREMADTIRAALQERGE